VPQLAQPIGERIDQGPVGTLQPASRIATKQIPWQFQQVEKVHDALTTLLEQDI
jgi:hypothetical protein